MDTLGSKKKNKKDVEIDEDFAKILFDFGKLNRKGRSLVLAKLQELLEEYPAFDDEDK